MLVDTADMNQSITIYLMYKDVHQILVSSYLKAKSSHHFITLRSPVVLRFSLLIHHGACDSLRLRFRVMILEVCGSL